MIPHANLTMEPSSKPLPPPPPTPKDVSNSAAITASSPTSTASSPRIRRKPLPPTAFSPRAVVASPVSVRSEKDYPALPEIPRSGAALTNVIDSASLPRPDAFQVPPTDTEVSAPTSQPNFTEPRRENSADISIADFPLPPRNDSLLPRKAYEDTLVPAKHEAEMMAAKITERPPPLRIEPLKAIKAIDAKKPQSPGSVFTSFFSRRVNPSPNNVSPGAESSATDISDSQSPSPYLGSTEEISYFAQQRQPVPNLQRQTSFQSSHSSGTYNGPQRMNSGASGSFGQTASDLAARCNMLEAELKEMSRELAGSIRRELDLEDLVEKLQAEAPAAHTSIDRTSDYFSDSGSSSVRHPGSEYSSKEEIDKIKRESEQQRAQLKIDLSQKWQNEVAQRKILEAHLQTLEKKLSQRTQTINETPDASSRIRELETSLDDSRRRLIEERQTKDNFEDLLSALRGELEQHRNERDNLRDEVVPNLRSQIDGLESSFGDAQKQAYEFARMQQEIQSLKDENTAISSARKMEQELIRSGMHFIPDGGNQPSPRASLLAPTSAELDKSNTISSRGQVSGLGISRSSSVSRPNSMLNRALPETPGNMTDKLRVVEQQKEALHSAVKYLRIRCDHQSKTYEKKLRNLQSQIQKLSGSSENGPRRHYGWKPQ